MPTGWQIISRATDDIFGIITGDETWLSTVELSYYFDDLKYESCIFHKGGDSEVLWRYSSKAEAMVGHIELAEKYNLK